MKWSFNRHCCSCCLNCFCTFDHLLVRFGFVCRLSFVVCRLCEHFSAVHSVVACAGDIRLLFKLLLKFQNVLKRTENRGSFPCNKNIKEDNPTALKVFLCFKTKRHTCKQIFHARKHPRNTRVISAEELGTMSKDNLRGVNLVRGPIWWIHSLTLIISCLDLNTSSAWQRD